MNEPTEGYVQDVARLRSASDRASYVIEKIFDLAEPRYAEMRVQSSTPFGDGYLVLHHGSVIQQYSRTGLLDELDLARGALDHPNDCQLVDGLLWVVDTGMSKPDVTPVVKVVDLEARCVVREIRLAVPDWRLAAISAGAPGKVWLVAVQAIEKERRDAILMLEVDTDTEQILRRISVPTDQYYVQGCALNGHELNVVINNGRSPVSKILRVDLDAEQVAEVVVAPNIGELEGLNLDQYQDRAVLISATKHELLRIRI